MTRALVKKSGIMLIGGVIAVSASAAEAAPKRDVKDPVLQEVISLYETRMPRFIKKHGGEVFVEDEPIKRGGLLLALYEYEQSLKMPQKNNVTRQELDEMRNRIALLEKGSLPPGKKAEKASSSDIVALLNELQPNMPVLLDNALNDSKVFRELRDEMRIRSVEKAAANTGNSAAQPAQQASGRNDLIALTQRIERMEQCQSDLASKVSSTSDHKISAAAPSRFDKSEMEGLMKRVARLEDRQDKAAGADVTRKDIERLEEQLEDLSFYGEGSVAPGAARQPSSFLTKVGVGVGMVAAFLIAR